MKETIKMPGLYKGQSQQNEAIILAMPVLDVEQKADDSEETITHYISTPDEDRGGDIVNPHGLDDTDFNKSKTVLFNHNYNFPVARNLWLKKQDAGVLCKTKFGSTQMSKDIYLLHKENILNSWSIGFQLDYSKDKYAEYKDGKFYINFWKMFEYSSVSVAMNPNAVDIAKGIIKSVSLKDEFERQEEERIIKQIISEYQKTNEVIKEFMAFKEEVKQFSEFAKEFHPVMAQFIADVRAEVEKLTKKAVQETTEIVGKHDLKLDIDKLIKSTVSGAISGFTGREK